MVNHMIKKSTVDKSNNLNESSSFLNFIGYFLSFGILIVFTNINNNIDDLTIGNIIIFFIGILLLRKRNGGLFNIVTIFYILCYIFHCSYFILIVTKNVCGNAYVFISLTEKTQIDTLKYCNYFFALFPIGSLLYNTRNINGNNTPKMLLDLELCGKVGVALMFIAAVPRLYVDLTWLKSSIQYGYAGAYRIYINNYVILVANLFYLGSILSIYGAKKEKNKATLFFLIALTVSLISMMSGRRLTQVAYLVIIIYMYFKCTERKKKSLFMTLMYILGVYTILAILATFGDLRETGSFSFASIMKTFFKNFSYKLIFDQFGEFGYAAYTLGATIEYTPLQGYGCGTNYLLSWLEVFPNIGGLLTGFSDKNSFVLKLPSNYQQALGGSLLGELFYNFGYWAWPFFILLGYILTNISNSIHYAIKKEWISSKDLIYLLSAIPMILWIRSVFNEFPRAIVWYYIVICIIRSYIYKKSKLYM